MHPRVEGRFPARRVDSDPHEHYPSLMARYKHLLFVCQNERPAESPKGCCARRGAPELLQKLKMLSFEAGLQGQVRITSSGCLDECSRGSVVVAYSDDGGGGLRESWYVGVTPEDAEELFESHIQAGQPLDRLLRPRGA